MLGTLTTTGGQAMLNGVKGLALKAASTALRPGSSILNATGSMGKKLASTAASTTPGQKLDLIEKSMNMNKQEAQHFMALMDRYFPKEANKAQQQVQEAIQKVIRQPSSLQELKKSLNTLG